MQRQITTALILALAFAGQAAANDELVAALKTLGKAVDNMSANISKAESDSDAQMLANVTRQALEKGLQDHPAVDIKAGKDFCRVTIETPAWKLWSEAHAGKITDHGATIR